MGLRILLLVVAMTAVECVDRDKLKQCPPPQKAFDVDKYVGDWYMQARLPPCSWAGSSDFSNHLSQYSVQQSGNIHLKDTWRNGVCASATLDLKPQQPSGVYTLTDPIGNVISGKSVIVATDYKKFAIKWGCSKTMGDICADPYVVVKTKDMEPPPHTWKVVDTILQKYWSLALSEMVNVVHDKNACATFAPEKPDVPPPHPQQHLLKTY